jgi:hypothetical protein
MMGEHQSNTGVITFTDNPAWLTIPNSVWGTDVIHRITADEIAPYTPVEISFETSEPARCSISLVDYASLSAPTSHDFTWINTEYKSSFAFTARLPARETTTPIPVVNNRVVALVRCYNADGAQVGKDVVLEFPIAEETPRAPTVLDVTINSRMHTDAGVIALATIHTDGPFDTCMYGPPGAALEQKKDAGCSGASPIYSFETPDVGYFTCEASIPLTEGSTTYITCSSGELWSTEKEVTG